MNLWTDLVVSSRLMILYTLNNTEVFYLRINSVNAFSFFQEWMTTKQGIDNCSGFILTVEQFSYAIFKTEGRWVLFDSHGCLRQSRFNSNHQISWNSAALVVSTSHLEKLLNILHDTHLGLGQCQIMAVNISPMAMTVSPVAHNPCSDNSADTVEATESQAILPEGTQDDAVVGPINERETVRHSSIHYLISL